MAKSKSIDDARKNIHQHLSFQECNNADGYSICTKCGEKVMLISPHPTWDVDQEAFKGGEYTADDDKVPSEVNVNAEITAHWCDKCKTITSLSFSTF